MKRVRHSAEQAQAALAQHLLDANAAGRRPSVLAIASAIGLSNTTFRRNYPDLVAQINELRCGATQIQTFNRGKAHPSRDFTELALLRRVNRELTEDLLAAAAQIRCLTIDNQHLRREIEAAHGVVQLDSYRKV